MKKYSKFLVFTILCLFGVITNGYATELSAEEFAEEVLKVNPDATYVYVVGKYAYTSDPEYSLKIQDLMLAARSIQVTPDAGEVKSDPIFNQMAAWLFDGILDDETFDVTGFEYTSNLVGTTTPADILDIEYIDYVKVNEKYTVAYDIDGEVTTVKVSEGEVATIPTDPEKAGYRFLGWYVDGEEYDFATPITEDITITAEFLKLTEIDVETVVGNAIATIASNDDYTIEYSDNTITITELAPTKLVSETTGTGLVIAVRNILNDDSVESITVTYNGVEYVMSDAGLTSSGYSAVMVQLMNLLSDLSEKNYAEAYQNDLIGKSLTLTITLNEDYISVNGNSEESYELLITGEKAKESEATLSLDVSEYIDALQSVFHFDGNDDSLVLEDGKLTGTLHYVEGVSGFSEAETTGYYFAYVVTTKEAANETTTVALPSETGTKVVGIESFDSEDSIVILFSLNPNSSKTTTTVTVDMDGEGTKYMPTTYTIDYSELIFSDVTDSDPV